MSNSPSQDPILLYTGKHSKYEQKLALCIEGFRKKYLVGPRSNIHFRSIGDIHADIHANDLRPVPDVEELQRCFKNFFQLDLSAYTACLAGDPRIEMAARAVEYLRSHSERLLYDIERGHWRPVMKQLFPLEPDRIIDGWDELRADVLEFEKNCERDLLLERAASVQPALRRTAIADSVTKPPSPTAKTRGREKFAKVSERNAILKKHGIRSIMQVMDVNKFGPARLDFAHGDIPWPSKQKSKAKRTGKANNYTWHNWTEVPKGERRRVAELLVRGRRSRGAKKI